MTVKELTEHIKQEEEDRISDEEEVHKAIIKKFSGIYLKTRNEDTIFGLEANYFRIDKVSKGSLDTDYNRHIS